MTSPIKLDEDDRQRFSEAVEASFAVSTRQQFFLWTHNAFRALVPHEILVCGIEDGSREGMGMHRFSASRYFRQEQFDAVSDPLTGLIPRLTTVRQRTGRPVVFCPAEDGRAPDAELLALVMGNEMKNLAAHLVIGARGRLDAFYCFSRLSCPLDQRLGYVIELLGPHVHTAFLRVLAGEKEVQSASMQRSGRLVTPRQEAILQLIKHGKTNAEIALVLECSPWTVKNHIQAILRKLDSNTRSHAIARAMSLGILRPD
ncbi:XrtB/PEP-CTERM-associated transcriptional regulator EpsA [Methylibium sp.]|uniref:XrtB/PEP-CTERM-associated transcriptional regulator EpsA n=1 Tax=Methylibium sp. TaxID=2067992 RepID=UPI003D0A2D77